MDPKQLSHELRKGKTPDLTRRRWVVGLSLLGVTVGQIVSLYSGGDRSPPTRPAGRAFRRDQGRRVRVRLQPLQYAGRPCYGNELRGHGLARRSGWEKPRAAASFSACRLGG